MDSDPAPCIAELEQHFQLLQDGGINIPDSLQAMILCKALPPQLEQVTQTLLVQSTTLTAFTIASACQAILAAWMQSVSSSMNCMYNCRGPQRPQQQQQQQGQQHPQGQQQP